MTGHSDHTGQRKTCPLAESQSLSKSPESLHFTETALGSRLMSPRAEKGFIMASFPKELFQEDI